MGGSRNIRRLQRDGSFFVDNSQRTVKAYSETSVSARVFPLPTGPPTDSATPSEYRRNARNMKIEGRFCLSLNSRIVTRIQRDPWTTVTVEGLLIEG